MSRSLRLVEWMLRRQGLTHGHIRTPVVLLRHDPLLADAEGTLEALGYTWQVQPVTGPLSLRHALRAGDRLVLILASGYAPPLDVSQRAWLRRPLVLEARDVMAAAADRFCAELTEPGLMDRLRADLDGVFERAAGWSFRRPLVESAEVEQILAGQRRPLQHQSPELWLAELLAQETPPATRYPLGPALRRAYPGDVGAWLAYALGADEDGTGRAALVSAGVLAGVPDLFEPFVATLTDWPGGDPVALARLVRDARRRAAQRAPTLAHRWLAPAEAAATAAEITWETGAALPDLRAGLTALEAHLFAALGINDDGDADAWIAWADHPQTDDRALLHALRALSRFAADDPQPEGLHAWMPLSREVAVADRLAREARRQTASAPAHAAQAAQAVFERYLRRRDRLNSAFAKALASDEARAYRNGPAQDGMALHTMGVALVRPLLEANHKVLLLVLDGCDQSTLLEVLDALPGVGPASPPMPIAEALPTGWITALSPVPTLTCNGRRALFGGHIPQNSVLTAEESVAADSANDKKAFDKHPAWLDYRARLMLKGDIGPHAAGVLAALKANDLDLLAVVFNAIDDSLSSKENTALAPWDAAHLGRGVLDTVHTALDNGWSVLVTADHGHTPHWSEDRKVKIPRGRGQRARVTNETTLDGYGQRFANQTWRAKPMVALTHVGGYLSNQHVGYHGGAGLEEVTVPVVYLSREAVQPAPTAWFVGHEQRPLELIDVPGRAPKAPVNTAPRVMVPDAPPPIAQTAEEPKAAETHSPLAELPDGIREVFEFIDRYGVMTKAQVIGALGNARAERRFAAKIDVYSRSAPFDVHAAQVGTAKHYVKVST